MILIYSKWIRYHYFLVQVFLSNPPSHSDLKGLVKMSRLRVEYGNVDFQLNVLFFENPFETSSGKEQDTIINPVTQCVPKDLAQVPTTNELSTRQQGSNGWQSDRTKEVAHTEKFDHVVSCMACLHCILSEDLTSGKDVQAVEIQDFFVEGVSATGKVYPRNVIDATNGQATVELHYAFTLDSAEKLTNASIYINDE
eukprot:TCALIF_02620-PA protein Name:"Protein of unknown function" AED:0.71 eAED:0.71 QI:0/0/0/0.4/1/1/5/0/196